MKVRENFRLQGVLKILFSPSTFINRRPSVCVCVCVSEDQAPPTFSNGRFGYTGGFLGPGRPRMGCIRGSPFLPYHCRYDCVRGNSNLTVSAPLSPAHFFLKPDRIPPRICWSRLDQIQEHKGQSYRHHLCRRGSSSGNLILYRRKYVHLRCLNWRPWNFSRRWWT